MELILHLGHKLSMKNGAFAKLEKTEIKKLRIQTEFRVKLGLIIDVPKQNAGYLNDSYTARRFLPTTQK
jgi:hypothetical protein